MKARIVSVRFGGLNEAACGGGRYAWGARNSFLSQASRRSIGPVMIKEGVLPKCGFVEVEQLLLTQCVKLLSPKEHK